MSDIFGSILLGLVIVILVGVAWGTGWGKNINDIKWCKRMKDTTWSECTREGQQVKVINNAL